MAGFSFFFSFPAW